MKTSSYPCLKHLFLNFFLITLFLYLGEKNVFCQDESFKSFNEITDILPPSPNAASLGKYGGINLNMSSGAIQKTIPIFELTSSKLSLPISISYASTGFKVDEIASRVGTGWNLNCGGVITRTVYGEEDDLIRAVPPSNYAEMDGDMVYFLESISNKFPWADGQPDIFSYNFNGYTGKFIIKKDDSNNYEVIQLTHSNIEFTFLNSRSIQAKDPNGITYLFDDVETTIRAQSGSNCSQKYQDDTAVTAFYLSQMTHPEGDVITFNYENKTVAYITNKSESIFAATPGSLSGIQMYCIPSTTEISASVPGDANCSNYLSSNCVILKEINCSTGSKIKFDYASRSDYNDSIVSTINVYNSTDDTVRSFEFNYKNCSDRPFLTEFKEINQENSLTNKSYKFNYYDLNDVPYRLSYSQDYWGYYNGKSNSTLIPTPSSASLQILFPEASANREPDSNYTKVGLLSSITYPTGGIDSIVYSGNKAYEETLIEPDPVNIDVSVSNSSTSVTSVMEYSESFSIASSQSQIISATCSSTGTVYGGNMYVELINESTDETKLSFNVYDGSTESSVCNLSAGVTYSIRITIAGYIQQGGTLSGESGLDYTPEASISLMKNVEKGGVRVSKVITHDPNTNESSTISYYYNNLSTPNISSGYALTPTPRYYERKYFYKKCSGAYTPSLGVLKYPIHCMHSNSIQSLYRFGGYVVTYEYVIEEFGENFENGGILHQYSVEPDKCGYTIKTSGELISGPYTDYSQLNGLELYKKIFSLEESSYKSIKEVLRSYKEDTNSSVNNNYKSYVVNKLYDVYDYIDPDDASYNQLLFDSYELYEYDILQRWLYVDTLTTRSYDLEGNNYIETKEIYKYDNYVHALPTLIRKTESDGEIKTEEFYYPTDSIELNLTGNSEIARRKLIDQHKYSLLRKNIKKENNLIYSFNTEYKNFDNDYVLPYKKYYYSNATEIDTVVTFNNYDDYGNLLELVNKDLTTSYLWGYNNQYPIAKIENAQCSQVYLAVDTVLINSLSNSDNDHGIRGSGTNEDALRTALDALRDISGAMVTTYTYDPLIGMTSETDPNGRTTYYEYDDYGRLEYIRDQDGNIIKKYEYKYATQTE